MGTHFNFGLVCVQIFFIVNGKIKNSPLLRIDIFRPLLKKIFISSRKCLNKKKKILLFTEINDFFFNLTFLINVIIFGICKQSTNLFLKVIINSKTIKSWRYFMAYVQFFLDINGKLKSFTAGRSFLKKKILFHRVNFF